MADRLLAASGPLHVPAAYGSLPNGWFWSRLDDICDGVFDCPHSTPKLTETGPFVVRTQDIITGVFRFEQAAHVSEETYLERIARVTPRLGDLLYSREGTYFGIAAEVPENTRVCLGQRMVLVRPDKQRLDFRFLRHWLNSPVMAAHIHGFRDGSVAERLNLPTIRGLPILVPPLTEQKAIAAVLGALDDKIELNRRMNATLEAMARALFQSWFVDFDPVRTRSGRFQSSPMGEIPEGWKCCRLREVAEVLSGGTPKKDNSELWQGDIPWISPKAMTQIHVDESDEHVSVAAIGNGTRLAPKGTTLIMVRGMGLHQGVRISQAQRDVTFNQDVKAIVAKSVPSTLLFYGCLHAAPGLLSKVHASGHGTGVLSTEFLDRLEFAIPPEDICGQLTQPLEALNAKIAANNRESRTLAALRDTLLPKLLSGEIRL